MYEIQLFKVLLSLKVVKFDTKMYLNFSNFWGRTSVGGGQALVQRRGQVLDGGIDKIFAGWGTPSPPRKKPCMILYNHSSYFKSGEINSCRLSDPPYSYAGTVMMSFDYIVNTNKWKLVPNKPTRWIGWSRW